MNNNATTLAQAFIPGTARQPASPMSPHEVVAFVAMMAIGFTATLAAAYWVNQEDSWSRAIA
jgi:hypothetical protein